MRQRLVWTIASTVVALGLPGVVVAQSPSSSPVHVGGNLGVGFATLDWVEVPPLVGYRVSERFSLGLGGPYRFRDDGWYPGGRSTSDDGASAFGRDWVAPYDDAPWVYRAGESVGFEAAPSSAARPGLRSPEPLGVCF